MRDWSRFAVFGAIVLLVVVLLARGPVLTMGWSGGLRPLLLMGLIALLFWKVSGGTCCNTGQDEQ